MCDATLASDKFVFGLKQLFDIISTPLFSKTKEKYACRQCLLFCFSGHPVLNFDSWMSYIGDN